MFYVACMAGFLLLARRPTGAGDAIVRVVLQFIIGFWLFLPMLLIDSIEEIAERVPVDIDSVRAGYLFEGLLVVCVSVAYVAIAERWWTRLGRGGPVASGQAATPAAPPLSPARRQRDQIIAYACGALVLASIVASIIWPSSYEEINEIGSSAGIGGKFGLPLVEPLLVSYLAAYFIFRLGNRPALVWLCFALVTAKSAVDGVQGSRFAVALPLLMLFLRRVIEVGRLRATRWLLAVVVVLFPAIAVLLIGMAEVRTGGDFSLEMLESAGDALEMLAIHFFIKSSSVVNAVVLVENGPAVSVGQAATALGGALTFFVPRALWPTKPISGSIDGAETGLPYRIAADLLGYPDWGNVGLSPFLTSYWILGPLGVAATAAIMVASLEMVRRFLDARGEEQGVLAGFALYCLGIPHMTGLWISFSSGVSMLARLAVTAPVARRLLRTASNAPERAAEPQILRGPHESEAS